VLTDDPRLTVRIEGVRRQPLRVIVDSSGRTPPQAQVFRVPGQTLLATTESLPEDRARVFKEKGAEFLALPARGGVVDLGELLRTLGQREVTSILVEGGGTLLGSLFDLGLVDKVFAFIAPIIVGGREAVTPVAGDGVSHIAQALRLSRVRLQRFGDDVLIRGYKA
jgi:diaminohydroxyphosphoribosylaminopyrimidine deaminase/5-amino-6-(5-phosphoribosylamino)uracil reductase